MLNNPLTNPNYRAMSPKRIFIIDDDFETREILMYSLKKEGFEVYTFPGSLDVFELVVNNSPDLIITDWLKSELDGLEFCRRLKSNPSTLSIPIIMLSNKNEEIDIVTALEIGAEDYITKPFRMKELTTRIKKVLKRIALLSNNSFIRKPGEMLISSEVEDENSKIKLDNILIDKTNHEVHVDDQFVNLTYSEFKLLELLADRPGKVFTRSQIIESEFGSQYLVNERAIDVRMVGLRKKLGDSGKMIKTIRSVGYKMCEISSN